MKLLKVTWQHEFWGEEGDGPQEAAADALRALRRQVEADVVFLWVSDRTVTLTTPKAVKPDAPSA